MNLQPQIETKPNAKANVHPTYKNRHKNTTQATIRMAVDPRNLKSAYNLIYKEYHSKAYVASTTTQTHINFWNSLPGTYTLIAEKDQQIIGTLTYIMDSDAGLPMDEMARSSLDNLRNDGRRLCEISGLAIDKDQADSATLMNLFQYGLKISSEFCQATDYVITINPRHAAFYNNYLCFEQIGCTHAYGKVRNAPGIPMRLNLETVRHVYFKKYGHLNTRRNLHSFFFVENQTSIIRQISRDVIERKQNLKPSTSLRLFKDVLMDPSQYETFCRQWRPYW